MFKHHLQWNPYFLNPRFFWTSWLLEAIFCSLGKYIWRNLPSIFWTSQFFKPTSIPLGGSKIGIPLYFFFYYYFNNKFNKLPSFVWVNYVVLFKVIQSTIKTTIKIIKTIIWTLLFPKRITIIFVKNEFKTHWSVLDKTGQ